MNMDNPNMLPETKKKVRIDRAMLMQTAATWFPMQKVVRSKEKADIKKLLCIMIPVILIFASLMAVIHSSVMIADANTEFEQLKNEEQELKEKVNWLSGKLTVKNDILGIEKIAREELGMVSETYLNQHYVPLLEEEGVDYYGSSGRYSVIASLLKELKK